MIMDRGLVLQLDAPDLAMERTMLFQDKPLSEFLAVVELHVAALNEALANIPKERVRLHCCWGNWEGPHTHDVPLTNILPLLSTPNSVALHGKWRCVESRVCQSPSSARNEGAQEASLSRLQDSSSRNYRFDEQLRRTSGVDRGSNLRRGLGGRRPYPRHRQFGLRFRN